jgi:Tfp pilus assembly protein PilF
VLNNLGVLYAKAGDFNNAANLFVQAITVDPKYRTPRLNLGLVFDKQDDKTKAAVYWVKFFNIDIDSRKPRDYVLFDAREFPGNDVLIADALDANSKKVILNTLAIVYAQQGDMKKAESTLTQALKVDPNYRTANVNLALLYDRIQDKDKSLQYWMRALNLGLDKLKPKDFILEERTEESRK